MKIRQLFADALERPIEPVVKLAERGDDEALAAEISEFVITAEVESQLGALVTHYGQTVGRRTSRIGIWISGPYGAGKSHLAKIFSLLAENPQLAGRSARQRLAARWPKSTHRDAMLAALDHLDEVPTLAYALDVNRFSDRQQDSLAAVVLSAYYRRRGLGTNLLYAKVLAAEFQHRGLLARWQESAAQRAGVDWTAIEANMPAYRLPLCQAASSLAPELFPTPADADRALVEAQQGELCHVGLVVDTLLADLGQLGVANARRLLVLDEVEAWTAGEPRRLAELQSLAEEMAARGRGRLWLAIATQSELGDVAGSCGLGPATLKKIEARFHLRVRLSARNSHDVLYERLLKKTDQATETLEALYQRYDVQLRDLTDPAANGQSSETEPFRVTAESFARWYPFLPYQIPLVTEVVDRLRREAGHDARMTSSTRTLLSTAERVLVDGERSILEQSVGDLVSGNDLLTALVDGDELADDGESIARANGVADAESSDHTASVLYLLGQTDCLSATAENVARLLICRVGESLRERTAEAAAELARLVSNGTAGELGGRYEYLSPQRREFERELNDLAASYDTRALAAAVGDYFVCTSDPTSNGHTPSDGAAWKRWLGFERVAYDGGEFRFRLVVDSRTVPGTRGAVTLRVLTPLSPEWDDDLEAASLGSDRQQTITLACAESDGLAPLVARFLAVRQLIEQSHANPQQRVQLRQLAGGDEAALLAGLVERIERALGESVNHGRLVFLGSTTALGAAARPSATAVAQAVAACWPQIFPKFDAGLARLRGIDRALAALAEGLPDSQVAAAARLVGGSQKATLTTLSESLRVFLAAMPDSGSARRATGRQLVEHFTAPPYGWSAAAVRLGAAVLVKRGLVLVRLVNVAGSDHADDVLLCRRETFDRVELELVSLSGGVLVAEARQILVRLAQRRDIDETLLAVDQAAEHLTAQVLGQAEKCTYWARGASVTLPPACDQAIDQWRVIADAPDPACRLRRICDAQTSLAVGQRVVLDVAMFIERHGAELVQISSLATQLDALRRWLPGDGRLREFSPAFQAAAARGGLVAQAGLQNWSQRAQSARSEISALIADRDGDELDEAGACDESSKPLRITRLEEWETLREAWDACVRRWLEAGYDVELR